MSNNSYYSKSNPRGLERRSSDGDEMYQHGMSSYSPVPTTYGWPSSPMSNHAPQNLYSPGQDFNISPPEAGAYDNSNVLMPMSQQTPLDYYTQPQQFIPSSTHPHSRSSQVPSPDQSSHPDARSMQFRIRQLEESLRREKERNQQLESQLSARAPYTPPGSAGITPPSSASFENSWKARTAARKRKFCSPNRAGNALCAWHDTRRERRAYPPRNAPQGYLNCGCTDEEALFEESLARNGVGSYLPSGDNVRMDPALRNPLLKLLQRRYGYRDGDFERDPRTGDWLSGEGHGKWEQESGPHNNIRRSRSERGR